MGLSDDIRKDVKNIFQKTWTTRDGFVVPDTDDVALGNDAVKLNAVVLYADLVESTAMVSTQKDHFAAEVYKSYLITVCKMIRDNEGEITAFDGDRVMAIFLGDMKNTNAARTALQINWAVKNVVNDELLKQYPQSTFQVKHVVGIDGGTIWVARTGIRGANDLVWVGKAANMAAKLCGLREEEYTSWITKSVYDAMADKTKFGANGGLMWEIRTWTKYNQTVYRSNWWWPI